MAWVCNICEKYFYNEIDIDNHKCQPKPAEPSERKCYHCGQLHTRDNNICYACDLKIMSSEFSRLLDIHDTLQKRVAELEDEVKAWRFEISRALPNKLYQAMWDRVKKEIE